MVALVASTNLDEKLAQLVGFWEGEEGDAVAPLQGLAPVLDVIRDPRWGRVDECISEDPYVVGTVGRAFVRGLQRSGVHATLKHFVGYSASRGGRNFGPVSMGRRELADIMLPPFEMAVKDAGARGVMHAYVEIDGLPVAADPDLLTGLLRERWGFDGVVVADYFGVAFLHILHGVAADLGEAAAQALLAGIDVELPTGDALCRSAQGREFPGRVTVARGCDVDSDDESGLAEAVAAAAAADIAILAVGDHAGLFGGGTVGEGCDRDDLELPGLQRRLIDEVLATGTPVILVLLTGRPYAVGWALDRCAAALQVFFPGRRARARSPE